MNEEAGEPVYLPFPSLCLHGHLGCSSSWSLNPPGREAGKPWGGGTICSDVGGHFMSQFVLFGLCLESYSCSLMKTEGIGKGTEKASLDKKTVSRGF